MSSRKIPTAKRMFARVEARRSAATAESGALATETSFWGSADAAKVLGVSDSVGSCGFSVLDAPSEPECRENLRLEREKDQPNADRTGSGSFREGLQDGFRGFRRGQSRGRDGEARESLVKGLTSVEAGFGFGGRGEHGADVVGRREALQHAAVEEGLERRVKEDDQGSGRLFEQQAVGELLGCASAEGEDRSRASERVRQSGGFESAEVGFAVCFEERGDGRPGAGFEMGVEIEELPVEEFGQDAADGGLAGAHKPGEDDAPEGRGKGNGLDFGWNRVGGGHRLLSLVQPV